MNLKCVSLLLLFLIFYLCMSNTFYVYLLFCMYANIVLCLLSTIIYLK